MAWKPEREKISVLDKEQLDEILVQWKNDVYSKGVIKDDSSTQSQKVTVE